MPLDYLPGTFFGPPNLIDLVRHRATHQPNDIAFTYLVDGENEEVHITNEELDRQARAIAAWLESHDLVGQRAMLLYPAGLEFIVAFFGCLYAGVTAVPVYPPRRNRSLDRIQAIADDAQAKVALTTDMVLRRVEPLIDDTPHLKDLTWLATCHVPEGMDQRWERPDVHGDTMAFLQYTSGSTGTPKGVMLNHANLLHNSVLIAHAYEHTRSALGVFWLPSYHDMGLIGGIVQPLYVGRQNVLMSPMSFLQKPFRWLAAITRFGATTSGGPNFAFDLCVRKVTPQQRQRLDLSTWKVAFNGAEPVRPDTLERFAKVFEPCGFRREAFYPCFGMAEATLIVSGGYVNKPPIIREFHATKLSEGQAVDRQTIDQEANGQEAADQASNGRQASDRQASDRQASSPTYRRLVGCGNSLPDQEIVVTDPDTHRRCPEGQVGEIWVRGPSVAQGYWGNPEATCETFQACLADSGEGPFLRTGDLGFVSNGELFVTGRIKDLIIHHGVNVYPQDIERTVQECHPRLRTDSGAAFAVEVDGRERLVIAQELQRRKQGDLDAVFDAIRRAISAEHDLVVDEILLLKAGSIPKTSSGKIQRHACRNGFLDDSLKVIARWEVGQPLTLSEPAQTSVTEKRERTAMPAGSKTSMPAGSKTSMPAGDGGPKPLLQPETQPQTQPETAGPRGSTAVASAVEVEKDTRSTGELVLDHVRAVARGRAKNLALDTPIAEIGLDSLERMEILASLEEHFGGRFPEEILIELTTCRQVVEAVETYLDQPQAPRALNRQVDSEIPPGHYNVDRFPEYVKLRENLDMLDSTGLGTVFFSVHEGVSNDRTVVNGREMISYSSFNYIGMSGNPVVTLAAQDAADRYGTSSSASRLVAGEKPVHVELEQTIARFVGTDDAITFVGGHCTNEAVIGHLLGANDMIMHDALAHNSILQGAALSGAKRKSFPHNNWQQLDEILASCRRDYRRVLIAIEGVYSMDGDIPELPKFIEIARRHKAMLMVDEAHSIGVLGSHGRGIGEHFDVNPSDVDVWMGTLSKAFGSCGGYIAGSKALVEYLKYTTPAFVFSCGISPPASAAAMAAIQLLELEPERATRLQARSRLFLELAKDRGLDTGSSLDSPVVPVIIGNSMRSLALSKAMAARDVSVQPILYPAVEEKASRLRFFLSSQHTEQQIRYTIDTLCKEMEQPAIGNRAQKKSQTVSPPAA